MIGFSWFPRADCYRQPRLLCEPDTTCFPSSAHLLTSTIISSPIHCALKKRMLHCHLGGFGEGASVNTDVQPTTFNQKSGPSTSPRLWSSADPSRAPFTTRGEGGRMLRGGLREAHSHGTNQLRLHPINTSPSHAFHTGIPGPLGFSSGNDRSEHEEIKPAEREWLCLLPFYTWRLC